MNQKKIEPGVSVSFDSDHGTQFGRVAAIKSDITNGSKVAIVEVPGAMDGAPWTVRLDDLRMPEAA